MDCNKTPPCWHEEVYIEPSSNAATAGFQRPAPGKRLAASTHNGREDKWGNYSTHSSVFNDGMTFPAPLVLPDDALDMDPKYPPQSFLSWLSYHKTVPVTSERNTIYVVPPPEKAKGMGGFMKGWSTPDVPEEDQHPHLYEKLSAPKAEDICDYLRAFYHDMPVKVYDGKFSWKKWTTAKTKGKGADKDAPSYIGLSAPAPSNELVGIRYRPSPDGIAKQQLNLSDILEVLLENVPSDAYAILMLIDEDLYEDDEDDFCCGRAYGASRICVVSSFRYNPYLDRHAEIYHRHMWPESHCKAYADGLCTSNSERPAKRAKPTTLTVALRPHGTLSDPPPAEPFLAAIKASRATDDPIMKGHCDVLWFSRVGRTASHELGHCLGFDHCVYFACVMQGTGFIAEDMRQPPYLCPVCLQKLSWALAHMSGSGSMMYLQKKYIKERYRALQQFCDSWKVVGMFAGWGAWLEKRLEAIEDEEKSQLSSQTFADLLSEPGP